MPTFFKLLLTCFFIFYIDGVSAQRLQLSPPDTTNMNLTQDSIASKAKIVPYRYQGIRPRSPWLALGLSLYLPGAGQVYNKQYIKAGAILFVESVSLGSALADASEYHNTHPVLPVILITPFFAAVIYSIIDAPVSASRINREYNLARKKRSFSSVHFSPGLMDAANGKVAAGFSLVLR